MSLRLWRAPSQTVELVNGIGAKQIHKDSHIGMDSRTLNVPVMQFWSKTWIAQFLQIVHPNSIKRAVVRISWIGRLITSKWNYCFWEQKKTFSRKMVPGSLEDPNHQSQMETARKQKNKITTQQILLFTAVFQKYILEFVSKRWQQIVTSRLGQRCNRTVS